MLGAIAKLAPPPPAGGVVEGGPAPAQPPSAQVVAAESDFAGAPSSAAPDPNDVAMVKAAQRGDRAAWGWLYRRYARLVHGVLVSRVAPHEAEDLVQDVFAKAMRTIGSVRESACVGAWLAAVARNRATDFQRQRRRRATVALNEETGPSANAAPTLEAAEVLAAIRNLPEAYRETLALRLVEGLTGPEIAQRLGMTHGSVRVNLHRGMAMLRQALGMEDTP
jgi:RNA polymerase sigma-70 factor, ECF subfamily